MRQLTKKEAVYFFDNEKWKSLSTPERALLQLKQERLLMPMDVFIESVESVIGTGVTDSVLAQRKDEFTKEVEGKVSQEVKDKVNKIGNPNKLVVGKLAF